MKKVGWHIQGYDISIEAIPDRVKPCLMMKPKGENTVYKVASFNSQETAEWFMWNMLEILADEETKIHFKKAYETLREGEESIWLGESMRTI